jgi:protein TonB
MSGGLADVLTEGRQLRRDRAPALFAVVMVHVVAGWALLSVDTVRNALVAAVPLVVTLIDSRPDPDPYAPPPLSTPQLQLAPLSIVTPVLEQSDVLLAPSEPIRAQPVESEAITDVEAVARPPVVASTPKAIPASAVEYIVSPRPMYPLYSRRARETGTVLLRVLINEKGMPAHVEIQQSSGYGRLDEAAVVAMRGARFKPYSENGVALSVWAPAPIVFEL